MPSSYATTRSAAGFTSRVLPRRFVGHGAVSCASTRIWQYRGHLGLPPLAGAGRLRGKQGSSICRSPAPVPFLPRIPPRSGVPAVEPHDPFADVVVRDP